MKLLLKKPKIFKKSGAKKTLPRLIEFWWMTITSSFFLLLIILAAFNFYLFTSISNDLLLTDSSQVSSQFKKIDRERLQDTVRFIEGKTGERIRSSGVDLPQTIIDQE